EAAARRNVGAAERAFASRRGPADAARRLDPGPARDLGPRATGASRRGGAARAARDEPRGRHRRTDGQRSTNRWTGPPRLTRSRERSEPMQVWTWDGWGSGTFDIAFNFGTRVINRHSHCVVSISELGGQPLDVPFLGAA